MINFEVRSLRFLDDREAGWPGRRNHDSRVIVGLEPSCARATSQWHTTCAAGKLSSLTDVSESHPPFRRCFARWGDRLDHARVLQLGTPDDGQPSAVFCSTLQIPGGPDVDVIFSEFFRQAARAQGSGACARRGRMTRRPIIEGLEDRICLTTDVWTGERRAPTQDYSWSNAGNWSDGKPQGGQDLVFPAASATTFIPAAAIMNDLSNMTFDSIEIDAPGYTLAGDAITLSATAIPGIVANYNTGVSAYSINTNLAGGWRHCLERRRARH